MMGYTMISHTVFVRKKVLKRFTHKMTKRLLQAKALVTILKTALVLSHASRFNEARGKLSRITSIEKRGEITWLSFRFQVLAPDLEEGVRTILVNLDKHINMIFTSTFTIGHILNRLPNDVYPLFLKEGLVITMFEKMIRALGVLGSLMMDTVTNGKKTRGDITQLINENYAHHINLCQALSKIDIPMQQFTANQFLNMIRYSEKIFGIIKEMVNILEILRVRVWKI
jgi:hypothetical protein